jgi:hypothetical protein
VALHRNSTLIRLLYRLNRVPLAKGKDSRILKFAVISSFVLLLVGLGWMAKEHHAPSVVSSSFSPPMGWTQLVIHLFCVGLPIALVMHIFASDKS